MPLFGLFGFFRGDEQNTASVVRGWFCMRMSWEGADNGCCIGAEGLSLSVCAVLSCYSHKPVLIFRFY